MIFSKYYDFLLDHSDKWIVKPMGYCVKCFAGQFSLWTYVYYEYDNFIHRPIHKLICVIVFISLSIFTVTILEKWVRKTN